MKFSMWVEWQNSVTHEGFPFGWLHSHMSCHNGSVEWGCYGRPWFSMAISPYGDPKAKKCPKPLLDFHFCSTFIAITLCIHCKQSVYPCCLICFALHSLTSTPLVIGLHFNLASGVVVLYSLLAFACSCSHAP